jgi:hypothetical protein
LKYLINNASKKVSDYLNETRRQAAISAFAACLKHLVKPQEQSIFTLGCPLNILAQEMSPIN